MSALSSYLKQNFNYDTGPFDNISKTTPGKPWLIKGNYNVNNNNKVTFRYNQLSSSTDVRTSRGRRRSERARHDADDATS